MERSGGADLLYEVALYREADDDTIDTIEAVPIGTKLQLRVSIDTSSVWRYVRLVELILSPSSTDPHARGHVQLVHDG